MSKWFNPNQILSYKTLVSVVVGMRGGGKTYGFKKKAIRDFIDKGEQFIWLRRYGTETDEVKKTFFNDIRGDVDLKKRYGDISYKVDGDDIVINDKIAGHFISLSTASKYKSTAYPKVTMIIFDEFIIERGMLRYMQSEVDMLYGLIETVQRQRDNLRCILIANAVKFNNPYFIEWRVRPFKKGFLHMKDRSVVIQMYVNKEFQKEKQESRIGKLTQGSDYYNMAIMNWFEDDNEKFIAKKPNSAYYRCTVRFEGDDYGFWLDPVKGRMYVNRQVDKNTRFKYTLSQKDHDINYYLVKSFNGTHIKEIVECYQLGVLYFSDVRVKGVVMEMLMYFIK